MRSIKDKLGTLEADKADYSANHHKCPKITGDVMLSFKAVRGQFSVTYCG